ncbi:MAG: ABC transporter ATP-binding protein [Candidatus Electrothrix sp. AR5]|nr:ABC transporter ATP-binding protein [Candidatus Electrothrix sp. AR5]
MNVIQIENLWKEYRLGVIGHGTLTHDLQSWWAKMRGKEDPNAKIAPALAGQEKQIEGDRFWALRDINLEVKEGEILGIIGKNGAGKSTLLKILSRVTAPTNGEIKVKGRIASLLEVGTGFHAELTGLENIFMNGAILGMSKLEIKSKLDEIIAFSGVEDFVNTPVKRYSSGMYVRLAFAVAAHLDPEILIIDEVLAVGDAEFQKKCLGKMQAVSSEGRTVIFVSHNMGAINKLCSRCLWIGSGRVREIGDTKQIVGNYIKGVNTLLSEQAVFSEDLSKDAQLRCMRLVNEKGILTKNFSCDEPVLIELTLQVNRLVPGLYAYLSINHLDGTRILVADSNDVPPNPLDGLCVGMHKIIVSIPERILGPGEYNIQLAFTSLSADNFYTDIPGVCGAFVLDDFTSAFGNKRPGYFSTILDWSVSAAEQKQ